MTDIYGSVPNVAIVDISMHFLMANVVTVTLIPGLGNTSLCEYSQDINAATNPDSSGWTAWKYGAVSIQATDTFIGKITALRFTRITGQSIDNFEVSV